MINGHRAKEAEPVGTCLHSMPFDLSAVSMGHDSRLAISYSWGSPPCPVEILRAREVQPGKRAVGREYELNDVGRSATWLRLSPDGMYLVARDPNGFYLFRLLNDSAKMIYSRKVLLGREWT